MSDPTPTMNTTSTIPAPAPSPAPAPAPTLGEPVQVPQSNPAPEQPPIAPAQQPALQGGQREQAVREPAPEAPAQDTKAAEVLQNTLIGGRAQEPQAEPQAEPQNETQVQPGAPQHYEPFYDLKEYPNPEIGKAVNDGLGEVARANNWTQEAAKKNFDQLSKVLVNFQAAQAEQWKKEALADPEIGGAKWPHTQQLATSAFNNFLTQSERELFQKNGVLNNKDVIKLLARIGERITPDNTPAGIQNGRPTPPQRMPSIKDFYAKYDQ